MERRKTPRTWVRKLAYVNFQPYNIGGVITEISASGLRFHTVAPLQQGGILRLSLVFAGMNHLEAVGEIVWIDSTRKVGGVRFVVLPSAAADQIRNWLEKSASARGSQDGPKSEPVPVTEPGALIPSASSVQPQKTLAPAAALPTDLSETSIERIPAPHGWVLPSKPSTMLSITHFDPDPPRRRSPFVRGLVGAVIVCLMLAPIVWFGLRRYNWLGNWIRQASPVVSNPVAATPTPTLMSGVLPGLDVSNSEEINSKAANLTEATLLNSANPAPPTEQAQPAVPNPNSQAAKPKTGAVTESPETSASETRLALRAEAAAPGRIETAQSPSEGNPPVATAPRNSVVPTSQHAAPISAPSGLQPTDNPGEAELILAWQYLEGRGGRPRDPVAASRLLWIAVEKGNMTAETTLASLFLRGEGVPKSCDQARVLLSAASAKGSTEAKQRLRELNQTGCR
jgi:hypothetical protein